MTSQTGEQGDTDHSNPLIKNRPPTSIPSLSNPDLSLRSERKHQQQHIRHLDQHPTLADHQQSHHSLLQHNPAHPHRKQQYSYPPSMANTAAPSHLNHISASHSPQTISAHSVSLSQSIPHVGLPTVSQPPHIPNSHVAHQNFTMSHPSTGISNSALHVPGMSSQLPHSAIHAHHFQPSHFGPPAPMLPPAAKKLRVDHTAPVSFPTLPGDVPVDLPTGYNLDFSFTDLTTDLDPPAVGMPTPPTAPPMTDIPVTSFPDTFFDGVSHVPNSSNEMTASTTAPGASHSYRMAPPGKPTSYDRHGSHPPSSPLSSGSGNLGPIQPTQPGLKHDHPGQVSTHGQSSQLLQSSIMNHNGHRTMQINPSTDHNGPSSVVNTIAMASSESPPPAESPDGKPGASRSEGRVTAQTKISDEAYAKRQADRAARNRESSRRAREKAKNRFRNMEIENYNLREMVHSLRLQNEYLQGQFERANAIQQSCHSCRYKASGSGTSPGIPVSVTVAGTASHTPDGTQGGS